MVDIKDKISEEARDTMRKAIEEASGNEVFFRGIPDDQGKIVKAQVLARGNTRSVPAILSLMRKGEVIIHNHPSGLLHPSDADIEVASAYANRLAGGSYIVNNNVDDLYVIIDLVSEENIPIDIQYHFAPDGTLASKFPGFEYRHEQGEMAALIEKGLNTETKTVVEAGTGTGKTLAYLIPVIEWAIANRKRAVISTNTINLQEQLLSKDIPLAAEVIGKEFKYLLVKGRGNYLCNRKYYKLVAGEPLDAADYANDQKEQYRYISTWGSKTETGDRAELPFEVDGTIWEMFCSEGDMCHGNKCPYRQECFFMNAREEKNKADILVTNHHMFFADLAIRNETGFKTENAIIPDYDCVVFDEAHNVEKVARDYFSVEVSRLAFVKIMNRILVTEGKKKNAGAFVTAMDHIKYVDKERHKNLASTIKEFERHHKALFKYGKEYFMYIVENFAHEEQGVFTYRIKPETVATQPFFKNLEKTYNDFSKRYITYIQCAVGLVREIEDIEDKNGIIGDFGRHLDRLKAFFEELKFVNSYADDSYIYWIEVSTKRQNAKLIATPLKVDKELNNNLFINLKELIFTSATLSVGRTFEYFKGSVGLTEKTLEKVIKSPFDYDNQMQVFIPIDFPEPNDQIFLEVFSNYIKALILKTKGNCFVLFTSYRTLNYIYYTVRDDIESLGFDLFIQGAAPRSTLLSMFASSARPVLFGTDSFWEGVDIKGEKLSSVIIARLPFKVPNDPVTEAILENIKEHGKNPFSEYQIPEAVIKFKQGIGRLIRSKTDTGIITVLDSRIVTKYYGKYFMSAIPSKNISIGEKDDLLAEIKLTSAKPKSKKKK